MIFAASVLAVYIPLLTIASRPKSIAQGINNSVLLKIAKVNRIDASVIKEYEETSVKAKAEESALPVIEQRPKIQFNRKDHALRVNHAKLLAKNRADDLARKVDGQGILKVVSALSDKAAGIYQSFSTSSNSNSLDAVLDQMTSITNATDEDQRSALKANAVSNRSASLEVLNTLLSDEEQQSISAVKGVYGDGIVVLTKPTLSNSSNSGTMAVDIQGAIDAQALAINSCYQKELKKSPDMKGKLSVTIKINTAGKVAGVTPTQNTIGESVSQCIVNKIRAWSFPKGKRGVVTVNQTFVFTK